MARAKNTSRAEARKRTRDAQRTELTDEQLDQESTAAEAPAPARPSFFKMPDVRGDIRALPQIFRTKRLIYLPAVLFLAGFALVFVLQSLPSSIVAIADLYLQFFFIPPALFTFFIAGYVAPRGSYLVGFLYGIFASIMWSIVILTQSSSLTPSGTTGSTTPAAPGDPVIVVGNMLLIGALYGTLAGAFAAWYRDFLRGMRERGAKSRLDREAKERAKRRDDRQEARRFAKGRPST